MISFVSALPVPVPSRLSPPAASQRQDLSHHKCWVAEEVVDGEKLWEGARLGVVFLCCKHGVAQAEMLPGGECLEHGFVKELRGLVQTETGRREGGDGAAAFGGDELLGERVEVRQGEKAVEGRLPRSGLVDMFDELVHP